VLKPFEKFTRKLSLRFESVSSILPTYKCLLNLLLDVENDCEVINRLRDVISTGLRSRMQMHINERFLRIATLLDPRYKNNSLFFDYRERLQNTTLLQVLFKYCI
jgi:hypothetical protein